MGVNLTPIIVKKIIRLEDLRGKSLAVDANNYLYQFLALIRTRDGTPLKDSHGNITSHLAGLMFRSTRLMYDYDMDLVFVFDGEPPKLKEREILKRRKIREKATQEWEKALKAGDYATAFSQERVETVFQRMKGFYMNRKQVGLERWVPERTEELAHSPPDEYDKEDEENQQEDYEGKESCG